ncbi:sensor histidine kinase [Xanthobacter agilis]|jgi:signal transduction histidine kinase|uniref:histidine kinase n=1 Tax=Xanthobacter agilis TaxID=47492 RepID=A0ABU0LDX7_XANAG|nr:HAMP domain-containing sensor histidine kinase [Xanthobacter agilis]MDQ0505338.1 signal transduction histidine kinase [Xanthobacter agilis]
MRRLIRGLFGRLMLGMIAVSVLAVCVTAVFLYIRFDAINTRFREGTLHSFAVSIAKDVHGVGRKVFATIRPSTMARMEKEGGRFIVLGPSGARLASSAGATDAFVPVEDVPERYFELPKGTGPDTLYGLSLRLPEASPPAYVQVAFPSSDVVFDSVLEEFLQDIAWLWIPFMLLMLATNLLVARIALRPLAQTVEEAGAIQPGGVSVSLSEKGLPDDVLALVRAVNQALKRLREGYRAQEEFSGDMAHELRTPLAVMKAQLAVIDAPYGRVLERELSGMERLVEQLLDRVRLGRFRIEPGDVVDLREVTREAAAFLAPRVVARGRAIEVEAGPTPVLVAGGRDDLFRAVRNLVENALEHAPAGSLISLAVTDRPAIRVVDGGAGFPSVLLDAERRQRGLVRSDRREGVGLGLAIVERTMQVHGGRLDLTNPEAGGACAEMVFPRPASPSLPSRPAAGAA